MQKRRRSLLLAESLLGPDEAEDGGRGCRV